MNRRRKAIKVSYRRMAGDGRLTDKPLAGALGAPAVDIRERPLFGSLAM